VRQHADHDPTSSPLLAAVTRGRTQHTTAGASLVPSVIHTATASIRCVLLTYLQGGVLLQAAQEQALRHHLHTRGAADLQQEGPSRQRDGGGQQGWEEEMMCWLTTQNSSSENNNHQAGNAEACEHVCQHKCKQVLCLPLDEVRLGGRAVEACIPPAERRRALTRVSSRTR
jgi:hypothetical protein